MNSLRIYSDDVPIGVIIVATVVATVAFLYTMRVLIRSDPTLKAMRICFIGWTLLPPLWFALEYFWLFKTYVTPEQSEVLFKHFEYGQSVASKVWAAVVAIVGARLYQKVVLRNPNPSRDRNHSPREREPAP